MTKILKVLGAVVICLVLVLLVLRVIGLDPHERRPGLWLKGDVATTPVTDWSYTDKYKTVKVQTSSWYLIPHSVTTFCIAYNGQLYLATTRTDTRQWSRNVARDPHVRLKIGDQLFDRSLSVVTDPAEREAVLQARAKKYSQQYPPPGPPFTVYHVVSD
jgi:hypothetical protein